MVNRLIIVDFGEINLNWYIIGVVVVLALNFYYIWTVHPEVRASSWLRIVGGIVVPGVVVVFLIIGTTILTKENNQYKLEDKLVEDFKEELGKIDDVQITTEKIGAGTYILLNGRGRYIIYQDKEETVWEKLEQ